MTSLALTHRHESPIRLFSDPAFLTEPYEAYAELRESGPIHWSDEFFGGAWVVTRHADVELVLRDARFSAQRTGGWASGVGEQGRAVRTGLRGFQRLFARAMLFMDSPDHGRLRAVLHSCLRPALISLAPRIPRIVADSFDAAASATELDFIGSVARPVPARVIAALLGLEPDDDQQFIAWSDDLAAFIGDPQPTPDLGERAQDSMLRMAAFFEALLKRRVLQPTDGLVSQLIKAEQEGRIQGGAELLAQCVMLLFAGHETTRNLLGNGLLALLRHRDEWRRLQGDSALLPNAIRELLRYDSPVQYTGRRVATTLELHGRRLERGDLVIALIGAANRDPRRHAAPDRLDIARASPGSLSFGHGPHVCIGASLTLMEAEAVFGELLRRWPNLQPVGPAVWNTNAVYRGLRELRVHSGASGADSS